MRSRCATCLLLFLACLGPAWDPPAQAQQATEPRDAVVRLRDGGRMSGALVEQTEEHIVLLIRNVRTTIDIKRVERIEILPPLSERYDSLREAIPDGAYKRRVDLARWLIEHGGYQLALDELAGVLSSTRSNDAVRNEAQQLDNYARAQIKLLSNPRGIPSQEQDREQAEHAESEEAPPHALSEEQINLVRIYETELNQDLGLSIEPGTHEEIWDRYADDPRLPPRLRSLDALRAISPIETVRLLFRLRARALYPSIRILDDPKPIARFRQMRTEWLGGSCATSECHGGEGAGGLRLSTFGSGSYTEDGNLYGDWLALDRDRAGDGTPLLTPADPASSPLLHLALPRGVSRHPHPRVRGWKPAFRSPDADAFERAMLWIGSIRTPRPDWASVYDDPSLPDTGG